MTGEIAAHDGVQHHRPYYVHFPPHPAREDDPHYIDFNHYHRKTRATARCYIGERVGFDACADVQGNPCPPPADGGEQAGLELHHAHIEFALQEGISLEALEADYPGVSDHRGEAGAHSVSHSDWEASQYVLGLIKGTND